MNLWTAKDAAAATKGKIIGQEWEASGVSIDSRSVNQGDLFIALAGPNFDGHAYVKSALEAGAVAALVHRIPDGLEDAPLILVEDTFKALEDLGRFARARTSAKIIAVTGSVGKTGTKEMLALTLSASGSTHYSVGSFNNHWGVPLSLARMPANSQYAIFELGMNHSGELIPLSKMVRPHAAIITTVEAVHSAHFKSVDEIAAAKAEIFQGLEAFGTVILNRDNPYFQYLKDQAAGFGIDKIKSFGSHIDAGARLLDCAVDPTETTIFALIGDHPVSYRVGVPGLHWAMNSLAVLLGTQALGADLQKAMAALAQMRPPKGRGERSVIAIQNGTAELIDESYNASPVSMRASLAMLAASRPAKNCRRHAVLGDMLELGEAAPQLHASLKDAVVAWDIDLVHTAGPLMKNLADALPQSRRGLWAENAQILAQQIKTAIIPGDVVMVKGSAGSKMKLIVEALKDGEKP